MNRLFVFYASPVDKPTAITSYLVGARTTSEAFVSFTQQADKDLKAGYNWTKCNELTPVELVELLSGKMDRVMVASALRYAAAEYGPQDSGVRTPGAEISVALLDEKDCRALCKAADKLLAVMLE
jgi:hypothetical protein